MTVVKKMEKKGEIKKIFNGTGQNLIKESLFNQIFK
jgi:hypothetical protein